MSGRAAWLRAARNRTTSSSRASGGDRGKVAVALQRPHRVPGPLGVGLQNDGVSDRQRGNRDDLEVGQHPQRRGRGRGGGVGGRSVVASEAQGVGAEGGQPDVPKAVVATRPPASWWPRLAAWSCRCIAACPPHTTLSMAAKSAAAAHSVMRSSSGSPSGPGAGRSGLLGSDAGGGSGVRASSRRHRSVGSSPPGPRNSSPRCDAGPCPGTRPYLARNLACWSLPQGHGRLRRPPPVPARPSAQAPTADSPALAGTA
jgi:hypothetical protein